MRALGILLAAAVALPAVSARADDRSVVLQELGQLNDACREAQRAGPRTLYVVQVERSGFGLGPYDPDERLLPVDIDHNLRALGGQAELFPAGMEPIGFPATGRQARRLRELGRRLTVGFFLGFDDPFRSVCLARYGVTAVRMDLAFVELTAGDGRVLARADTERLRAWRDDRARDVPGSGPRGALGATVLAGRAEQVPEAWRAPRTPPALRDAIARCHQAAVQRGAVAEAEVVVRLSVEPRTGSVRDADVELSSLRDAEGAACVADALLREVSLPPAPDLRSGRVTVSVPVRLTAD